MGFLLVEPGRGVHEVVCFAWVGGAVEELGCLKYPLAADAVAELWSRWRARCEAASERPALTKMDGLRLGLVVRSAMAGVKRGGLVLRASAELSAEGLSDAIERHADALGVRARPPKETAST